MASPGNPRDEEAFWDEMHKDEQAERREYEERLKQRQPPRSVGRGLGTATVGAVKGFQELLNRAVAPPKGGGIGGGNAAAGKGGGIGGQGKGVSTIGTINSRGLSSSLLELKSKSPSQFHYQRMDDNDAEEDKDDREGWAPVANLDLFFQNMYKYYQNKGFNSILASGATNLVSMGFTVALSTWLFAFVDWSRLTTCNDEESCQTFDHYIHSQAVARPVRYGLVWIYCALFCCYWCASCYWFMITLKDAAEMQYVYENRLGISNEELVTVEWHEVVARFLDKQQTGEYRVSINREITAHDIACRIMRRENFLIAFFNRGILDLHLPLPFIGSKRHGSWSASTEQQFLTRNLEWSLHVCVLNDMLNEKFLLRREFLNDEAGLRRRFVMAGLLQMALMPFLLVFMVMQFFLQNAQEWQQKKNYLGPRQWSPLAQWKFREYNEVVHIFERRLHSSYPFAMQYTRQCPKPVIAVLARCFSYISGSVVAVLLLFTLLDESIILYVKLWDRNLLWYVGIFSAIFAMSRSLIPGPEEYYCDQEQTMKKVAAHTHYFPAHWKGRCNTNEVRQEFLHLFQYKTALFQQEILSVVVTPIILCFALPECAKSILDFLKDHHEDVEGLGSVCSYSLFDLEKYGTVRYGGVDLDHRPLPTTAPSETNHDTSSKTSSSCSTPTSPLVSQTTHPAQAQQYDGKVEKSYLNFRVNYPEWQTNSPAGKAMLLRLHTFQEQEMDSTTTTAIEATCNSQKQIGGGGGGTSSEFLKPPPTAAFFPTPAYHGGSWTSQSGVWAGGGGGGQLSLYGLGGWGGGGGGPMQSVGGPGGVMMYMVPGGGEVGEV